MKTVIRIGNRVKPTPEKGLEQISGMEINAKVELIQALIPLEAHFGQNPEVDVKIS